MKSTIHLEILVESLNALRIRRVQGVREMAVREMAKRRQAQFWRVLPLPHWASYRFEQRAASVTQDSAASA
jgi:hypothetical protein